MAKPVVSVDELGHYLGTELGEEATEVLAQLEQAAVEWWEDKTGVRLDESGEVEEILSGDGSETLHLKNDPSSITRVEVRGHLKDVPWSDTTWTEVDAGNYLLKEDRLISLNGWWQPGESNIRVTYTAGYSGGNEPSIIRKSIKVLVAFWFSTRSDFGENPEIPPGIFEDVQTWKNRHQSPKRLARFMRA